MRGELSLKNSQTGIYMWSDHVLEEDIELCWKYGKLKPTSQSGHIDHITIINLKNDACYLGKGVIYTPGSDEGTTIWHEKH